ncbi:hypothetical protein GYMLUDRAFT_42235 [Collybiopsis luxurians FD-317 M1]|uniref:Uncharacterized protein n=1 Tax=Collybiopsis luxurians FD-317 M1 TaxID=944289 RepID=A0A0D0D030_9AGAR|nr:hypothetical protein GYMLUDRAFT_42235 [Collybiopsis luxurians FD-317 M1]
MVFSSFTSFESTNISPTTPASKQIVILYNQTGILEVSPVVDQISAIADVRACFITTEPEATEFDSVPSIWSQLLALLIGKTTAIFCVAMR